ncbi:MAG: methyltransferase domain-containing protein [Actinophytocola sp.]|uniref:class I SAM-dependent methyltransferase n=1 Tax=Actinophytocola sp. TaxID=1872138 RepID=UPI001327ED6D|nr:class I SAM-dependent methyltransferase [Actinophytocola sp.]MPZ80273.1 methyltransferase domain-containing protein [Actinophytocola sp.]
MDDRKALVRKGYDALSRRYDDTYGADRKYAPWLASLTSALPPAATVVDLGCGSGVPVARALTAAGHRVTGVDFSAEQVRRARALVPAATFVREDLTAVSFEHGSVDAVVAFYSIIHVPLDEQPALLGRVATWLRPGGLFAATMGHTAWTGTEDDWLGGGVPMWWSHADAATNRAWLAGAGVEVEHEEFVPEGDGGAVLFVARRPT